MMERTLVTLGLSILFFTFGLVQLVLGTLAYRYVDRRWRRVRAERVRAQRHRDTAKRLFDNAREFQEMTSRMLNAYNAPAFRALEDAKEKKPS